MQSLVTEVSRDGRSLRGASGRRLKRAASTLWLGVLAVVVVYSIARSTTYSSQIVGILRGELGAQTTTSSIPLRLRNDGPHMWTVTPSGSRVPLDLRRQTAVVLLYDDHCPACKDNMPRWLDLIVELRKAHPRTPVFAVSLDVMAKQRAYWVGLDSTVILRQLLSSTDMVNNFGTTSIPSTVVVRDGRVVAIHTGAIGKWRRAFILRSVGQ